MKAPLIAAALGVAGTAALPALFASPVAAAPAVAPRPFTQAAFDAAKRAGKPILIDVHAPWCPVCAAQQKVIASVTADPRYKDLVILRVDYDTQKPVWKALGAQKQSTLIGYRGASETGRLAYTADPEKVRAVIAGTVG
ncbi:thioredoxin family protein [Sphingomonas sp. BGYR3]|uniref:thioredoxin family protein n=1 Tax=Sphingomonas sp. BGYR3 TaxID=2975483 RepID=UPI0021A3F478|nr:thioredoxin family protein [Sphingomonas sp. BGYR3]MDG5488464.1 thioredoxin family protein [Sphingomonas sp. BGYR3]